MPVLRLALWWSVPGILLAVAAYELSLALQGRMDERVVTFVGILVIVVGAGLAALATRLDVPMSAVALFAPTAAAFVVAHFYTYDPYYTPTLRRYSDDGAVRPAWMFFMAAAALVAGVVTSRERRIGAVLTSLVLFVLAGTAVLASDGH